MNNEVKDIGLRIIVEGPECVGKDTFISRLVKACQEKSVGTVLVKKNKVSRKDPNGKGYYKGRTPRYIRRLDRHISNEAEPSKLTDHLQIKVINFIDNCKETKEFYKKMHSGVLTQEQIANEFLQVHYDNELYTREMEEIYSVVIMNRALATYKANQIIGDGFTHLEEKYQKLVNHSYEDDALFILLKAPFDVISARLAKREEEDFRGDIEQHFMQKHEKISAFYEEEAKTGNYKDVMVLDTSCPEEEYSAFIEAVVSYIIAEKMLNKSNVNPQQGEQQNYQHPYEQPSSMFEEDSMFSE